MRALSVRQPWPHLIFHGKDVENRAWGARYPSLFYAKNLAEHAAAGDGHFLIHAGKGMTQDEFDEAMSFADDVNKTHPLKKGWDSPSPRDLPRGGIIGIARLVEVVTEHPSPWFFGDVGLVLADAAPLPFRPLKGALGFFEVPGDCQPKRSLRTGEWAWPERVAT